MFAAFQPGGAPPPSSTNWPLKSGQIKTNYGELVDASTPRAIKTEEVAEFCEQFRIAARNAIEAGKTHAYSRQCNTTISKHIRVSTFIDRQRI